MKLDKTHNLIPEISTLGRVKNIIKKESKGDTGKRFLRELNRRSGKKTTPELTKEEEKRENKNKYGYNHEKVKKVEAYTPPGKKVKIEKNGKKGHIIDVKI